MNTFSPKGLAKIVLFSSISVLFVSGFTSCDKTTDPVELTFTSWRIDDVAEMDRVNALFTKTHPDITIHFESHDPLAYDAVTTNNLARGSGADIIFLWSYDKGRTYQNAGYLCDLTKVIPNLASFPQVPLKAWTTESGLTYGVPSVGVTHGIFYNKSIFAKYTIGEPATWDDFIAACEKLLAGGETVIAQGAADNSWTFNRVIFCGLGANFYGGETARQALMAGTMKHTDANFVDAFKAVYSLKKYLPVKKAGDKLQYCFHVDAGIGVNKNSKNLDAALEYVKWTAGLEYAQAVMTELPGFFSYTPGATTPANPLAQKMFNAATTATLTVRLMDEKFNSKTPGGDALMNEALQGMMLGTYTPESAAAYVQGKL